MPNALAYFVDASQRGKDTINNMRLNDIQRQQEEDTYNKRLADSRAYEDNQLIDKIGLSLTDEAQAEWFNFKKANPGAKLPDFVNHMQTTFKLISPEVPAVPSTERVVDNSFSQMAQTQQNNAVKPSFIEQGAMPTFFDYANPASNNADNFNVMPQINSPEQVAPISQMVVGKPGIPAIPEVREKSPIGMPNRSEELQYKKLDASNQDKANKTYNALVFAVGKGDLRPSDAARIYAGTDGATDTGVNALMSMAVGDKTAIGMDKTQSDIEKNNAQTNMINSSIVRLNDLADSIITDRKISQNIKQENLKIAKMMAEHKISYDDAMLKFKDQEIRISRWKAHNPASGGNKGGQPKTKLSANTLSLMSRAGIDVTNLSESQLREGERLFNEGMSQYNEGSSDTGISYLKDYNSVTVYPDFKKKIDEFNKRNSGRSQSSTRINNSEVTGEETAKVIDNPNTKPDVVFKVGGGNKKSPHAIIASALSSGFTTQATINKLRKQGKSPEWIANKISERQKQ